MARLAVEKAWIEFHVSLPDVQHRDTSMIGGTIDAKRGVVTALRDISFDLRDGDRLGIMGHNGAGKSTLLRMLSGAYPPTRGRMLTSGTISTLFNTMPGLSTDGTGRENILNCGLHLGLTRREIKAKMDEIIDFAELGDFVDLPVRVYSSGMMTRLGFSVATAIEPEILLLDEGLATGDAHFSKKAEQKLNELFQRSSILVIASHSSALLSKLCNRSILLQHGVIVGQGPTKDLYDSYLNSVVLAAQSGTEGGMHQAFRFAMDMLDKGEKPPLELEEQALRYVLTMPPDQAPQIQRYIKVLQALKKPVGNDLVARLYLAMIADGSADETAIPALRKIVANSPESLTEDLRARVEAAIRDFDTVAN
jgi:ABC-type polysaccharide/polyol phosphate transport system ATPase subunit